MNSYQPHPCRRQLDQLLAAAGVVVDIDNLAPMVAITGISDDSRTVQPGDLYLALRGSRDDGRVHIAEAIERGAAAVLAESGDGVAVDGRVAAVPVLAVRNLRALAGPITSCFFGIPSKDIVVVAVTGTNGKTTTSWLTAQALERLGVRAAVLGTLGVGAIHARQPLRNTTPGAVELQTLLAGLRDAGFAAVVLEASSIGIEQQRLTGTQINTALFTNLSRDHLDYHGSMDAYAEAKAQLFSWPSLAAAVINGDDPVAQCWLAEGRVQAARVLVYGSPGRGHDVELLAVVATPAGMQLQLRVEGHELQVTTKLVGDFNAGNLLAVIGALRALGHPLAAIAHVLGELVAPVGRMEVFGAAGEPLCVVDYAHTPDALEKVLSVLRQRTAGALWCVFGCGGNRDRGKRPQMGAVAAKLADHVVVTSDNPRDEDPDAIIAEIVAGAADNISRVTVETDRARAIAMAVRAADSADAVLIAGKGHEDYQEIAGQRLPFSDQHEIGVALALRRAAMSGGVAC